MVKIIRNLSTPESRAFWESVEKSAAEVSTWPDWKRAGINVSNLRDTPRVIEKEPMTDIKLVEITPEEGIKGWKEIEAKRIGGPFPNPNKKETIAAIEVMSQHFKDAHPDWIKPDGTPKFWCGGFGSGLMFSYLISPTMIGNGVDVICGIKDCTFKHDVTDLDSW